MKAKKNILKTILVILVVILISLISFIGVFRKDKNKMMNFLPNYQLGMDFTGGRTFSLKVADSNKKENLTNENYEKAKDILIKRLKQLGIKEYEVRKNSTNGEINVTIPEDNYTDTIVSEVYQGGEFKIVDTEEANVSSVLTSEELEKIDKKLKEKNISNYKVAVSKKEEKVEATEDTPESMKTVYEVNIILPEGNEIKKEDLELYKYNVITSDISAESIILSSEKINEIKEETNKLNVDNYSIKVKDDNAYILNSDKNKVDKIAGIEVKSEILLGKENIKDVQVAYARQTEGTAVILNIQYDKKGTEILNELSKIYVKSKSTDNSKDTQNANESTEQNTEDSSKEENETSKTVDLVLDGQKLLSTELDEGTEGGKLQLSMGQVSSDVSELSNYLIQGSNFAVLLKTDSIPVTYELDTNLFKKSDITNDALTRLLIFALILGAVVAVYIIVKYKKQGALAVISIIGYISTLLLVIRCISNVTITITGVVAIILGVVMDIVYKISIIKSSSEKAFKQVSCRFLGIYLPVLAISVVCTFNKFLPVASFGGIMFWSLLVMGIYNLLITNFLMGNSEEE